MPSVIVVGAQWGDEGKGKVIDILTAQAKHVIRAQGGNNAGHTVIIGKEEYKLHLIPSGILHPHTQCYIGSGTVLDPEVLLEEIKGLESRGIKVKGRLAISPMAHVIFSYHKQIDLQQEKRKGGLAVGTTGRGIGPCYADKINRVGIRIGELVRSDIFPQSLERSLQLKNEELIKLYDAAPLDYRQTLEHYTRLAEQLAAYVRPIEEPIAEAIKNQDNILLEGAQGTFLDITSGTYPYVTSSNTVAGGICVGAGVGPSAIDHTLGVIKAYTTRVGKGPFPTETSEEDFRLDHQKAREYGTTTGRKRRVGWFDAVLAKTAGRLNGLQSLALTKLDILDKLENIKVCVAYELNGKRIDQLPSIAEDFAHIKPIYETLPGWQSPTSEISSYEHLPANAKNYLQFLEKITELPIIMVSVGPERDKTIILKDIFTHGKAK